MVSEMLETRRRGKWAYSDDIGAAFFVCRDGGYGNSGAKTLRGLSGFPLTVIASISNAELLSLVRSMKASERASTLQILDQPKGSSQPWSCVFPFDNFVGLTA